MKLGEYLYNMKVSELNKFIEETLINEAKKAIINESEALEVYHLKSNGEPIGTFNTQEEAEKEKEKIAGLKPGQELIIDKATYESYGDMLEKLDAMGEELGETNDMKKNTEKINEGLSPKGVEKVQQWCDSIGCRETGKKLIDIILSKTAGVSSSDLADTAIFANGLDEIEAVLADGDYDRAYEMAKEVADDMLSDEGFPMDMDEEGETMEGNEFTAALLKAKEEGKDKFTVDGKEYDVKECWSKMEEETKLDEEDQFVDAPDNVGFSDEEMEESKMSTCNECGAMLNEEGMCSECGMMKESVKKKVVRLKESEVVGLIKKIVTEAMKGEPGAKGIPGLAFTKKAQGDSLKNSNDHLKTVESKMKEYLSFDGNDNPEFPNAIGKGEKAAVNLTTKQEEEVAKNSAGLQNLDYDTEPSEKFKERLKMAIDGDSKMGNAPTTEKPTIKPSNEADKGTEAKENIGNVINSEKANKKLKKQIADRKKDKDDRVLYDKQPVPVKSKVNESKELKTVDILNEELDRMKKLSKYSKKTQ